MNYEILQMQIVPLMMVTATAASAATRGSTLVPGNLPYGTN